MLIITSLVYPASLHCLGENPTTRTWAIDTLEWNGLLIGFISPGGSFLKLLYLSTSRRETVSLNCCIPPYLELTENFFHIHHVEDINFLPKIAETSPYFECRSFTPESRTVVLLFTITKSAQSCWLHTAQFTTITHCLIRNNILKNCYSKWFSCLDPCPLVAGLLC